VGYDIHITKAQDWFDSKSQPILEADWLSVVGRDPTLSISHTDELRMRDRQTGVVRVIHPVVWTGPDGEVIPLWFDEGRATTKNPSKAAIAKMKEIAARLGAHVVGDEGERY
jgi:hypothetical protein